MKRADQVLAACVVDAGLAADRGIHLRQQRGRNLHEINSALVNGRNKPGQIADHAAAQRDQQAVARQPGLQQPVQHTAGIFKGFLRLAGGQRQAMCQRQSQTGAHRFEVMRRHIAVADQAALAPSRLGIVACVRQQVLTDADRVAACAQIDRQRLHKGLFTYVTPGAVTGRSSWLSISCARIRALRPCVSITRSATSR